jgi:hypothetical protein
MTELQKHKELIQAVVNGGRGGARNVPSICVKGSVSYLGYVYTCVLMCTLINRGQENEFYHSNKLVM